MLDQVLDIFQIKPDYDLGIMKQNQSLFDVTVNGLKKLESILRKEKPDIILVQGDTTTTFIAGLAAYYLKIKIGHIEAGLRTKDKFNPFPEEINRRLTDCLADLYFVHTKQAKENLLREGVN
jgi:UDP-N-acetylglucosamine 2-epimerase (non-hydrolysing)